MSTKDSDTLNQQRQRRKRINRMKTIIIFTMALWMLLSFITIIVLVYQVVRLNQRLDCFENSVLTQNDQQENLVENGSEGTEIDTNYDISNIVTGIDSADNIAEEGDIHKVYLTFDNGPDENTNAILDVLDQYQVKATFFVVGNDSEEMKSVYQRIANDGHTLGMHSYSNKYSTIYASQDAFTQDFTQLQNYILDTTGYESTYYRFPGGSSNEISNVNMAEFVHVLNQNQVTYFDWNVSAGDASSDYTVDDIISNVTQGVSQYKTSVVLLHDGDDKNTTVEALGPLIEALLQMQCEILPIDENTKVIQYIKSESIE